MSAVVGPEVERAARLHDHVWIGFSGAEVADHPRPSARAVASPQLVAVGAVIGREHEDAVHAPQVVAVGARRAGPDVAHKPRSIPGAVGAPELVAVLAVVGAEEDEVARLRELLYTAVD